MKFGASRGSAEWFGSLLCTIESDYRKIAQSRSGEELDSIGENLDKPPSSRIPPLCQSKISWLAPDFSSHSPSNKKSERSATWRYNHTVDTVHRLPTDKAANR
jgi:hypothetical protein